MTPADDGAGAVCKGTETRRAERRSSRAAEYRSRELKWWDGRTAAVVMISNVPWAIVVADSRIVMRRLTTLKAGADRYAAHL
jgi:hypothetical protein